MTYTAAALVAVVVAAVADLAVLRTRLVRTRTWWTAYAIVLFFQLLTNGWRLFEQRRPGAGLRLDHVTSAFINLNQVHGNNYGSIFIDSFSTRVILFGNGT